MKKQNLPVFTILELLVVVAVMLILTSLLLPGLRNARETGKRIKCAGNMKQLSSAFAMYATDFNNRLPPTIDGNLYWWCRNEILGPYFGYFKEGGGIVRCPSSPNIPINHAQSNYTMNTRGNARDYNTIPQATYAILLVDGTLPNLLQFDSVTYVDRVAATRHINCTNCLFIDGHVAIQKNFSMSNVQQGWQ